MKLPRRNFLHRLAGAVALPALSCIARAQAYPTRQVTIIVGFPVGGGIDLDARLMGQWLSDRLGQPFNVENRTGSGSALATEAVVRAPADGYTLLLATAANALGPALYPNLKYDFIRDTCRSRKFHPARIRAMRENQSIIWRDACHPPSSWDVYRQPIQVATPA